MGPVVSLMQMVALQSAFTNTVSNKLRGHQRIRWSSQEIGSESNGPLVKSAIVEAMTTQLSLLHKTDRSTSDGAVQAIQAR